MSAPSPEKTGESINFADIARLLRSAQKIVILTHNNPDGDALGTARALQLAWLKKQMVILSDNQPAEVFCRILQNLSLERVSPFSPELVIIVDCNEIGRVNMKELLKLPPYQRATKIVIDHHKNDNLDKVTNLLIRDTKASSSAELLWHLFEKMKVSITPEIATSLLLGIYTDTGGFQHANTSEQTLRAVGKLVSRGGDLLGIAKALSPRQSLPKVRLWGGALSKIFINQSKMAVAIIKQADLEQSGACDKDVAGLVNALLQLKGASAAAVFLETARGWRVSMRSRQKSRLGAIAKFFGGRGRDRSAGFLATKSQIQGKIN